MATSSLILASASPRRQEILTTLGLKFEVDPPRVEEMQHLNESPRQMTERLALEKAQEVAKRHPDAVILGADTVVALGEKGFGKPSHLEEARVMLRQLSGQTHSVFTGFALFDSKTQNYHLESVETRIIFHSLSDTTIETYLETKESLDKAGAYGIQGHAGRFVKAIQGSYSNVVGLPLEALTVALAKFGIQARS